MRRTALAVVLALTGSLAPVSARAQPSRASETRSAAAPRVQLRHDLVLDLTATSAMTGAVFGWGLFIKPAGVIGSSRCTICDGPGREVNAVDDFFRSTLKHERIGPAAVTSHVLSYGGSPAAGIGLTIGIAAYDGRVDEAPLNALLAVEASLAAVIVKELLSLGLRRERPEVHALEGADKRRALSTGDPLESFPSGHLASELAIMTAVGTIATMRGYRLAPLAWVVGGALGLAIGYLRIASDQHYFTDNVAGGAIGIGVGAAVPLIFHRPRGTSTAKRWLDGTTLVPQRFGDGRGFAIGWAF